MVTIRQTVTAATPELFRAELLEQIHKNLAETADANSLAEIWWTDVEVLAENVFEFTLQDVNGKQCRATLEIAPIILQ